MGAPRIAVAVVTMGNRPDEVDALLRSLAKQDIAPARIVIVGNGCAGCPSSPSGSPCPARSPPSTSRRTSAAPAAGTWRSPGCATSATWTS